MSFRKIALLSLVIGFLNSNVNAKAVDEIYVVKSGDTLASIASMYIEKNTYAKGGSLKEYIFNIVHEWNYEQFKDRKKDQIYPGDKLALRYWVKDED